MIEYIPSNFLECNPWLSAYNDKSSLWKNVDILSVKRGGTYTNYFNVKGY